VTSEHRHRQYPIVRADGALLGLLGAAAIIKNIRDAKVEATAGELMDRADELLHDVNVDRCPVVAADGSKHVVGFLSPADLVRARFRVAEAGAERADITLF